VAELGAAHRSRVFWGGLRRRARRPNCEIQSQAELSNSREGVRAFAPGEWMELKPPNLIKALIDNCQGSAPAASVGSGLELRDSRPPREMDMDTRAERQRSSRLNACHK
jgi:hypothetical protein